MKKWNAPVVEELSLESTAHGLFKRYWDGGYVGDGIISGHTTNQPPVCPNKPTDNPVDPVDPVNPEVDPS